MEPIAKKAIAAGSGASIAGPAGIVIAVVAGGVADVVVNNMWQKIQDIKEGRLAID